MVTLNPFEINIIPPNIVIIAAAAKDDLYANKVLLYVSETQINKELKSAIENTVPNVWDTERVALNKPVK